MGDIIPNTADSPIVPRVRQGPAVRAWRAACLAALAVLVSTGALAEAQPPSSASAVPGLRLPRDVVPLHYEPRLTVDPALATFGATLDIVVRVDRATDVVWLNAKNITLRDAKAVVGTEELPAVRITGSDDVMGLKFERPLPVGEARLVLSYTAPIDSVGAVGVFRQREGERWYVVTQFEPVDARRAFPCFDEPDLKAQWRLTLVIPRGMRAFANMPVEREADAGADMKEVTFARTPPLPSYLVAFAVGEWDVRDGGRAGRNGTPISIVVPKGRADEAAYAARHTGAILAATEHFFGQPYPFPKLDLVAYPRSTFGGAMENPGLITYTSRLLLARPDETSPVFEQYFMGVTAHEIAHMWFGDYVTMAWWDDIWLNESFASWLGTAVVAQLRPDWPPGAWRSRQRLAAIEFDQLASARRIRQPVTEYGEMRAAFDSITYAKGETVLAMFEQWLGPEKFRDGVRRYVAQHAWGNATAEDFFAALAATDDAMLPAFRGFIERPGVPLLSVALDCTTATPTLALTQQRFGAAGTAAPADAERWVFPACFEYGDGAKGRQTCALIRESTQRVPLDTRTCPQWVVANRTGLGYYLPRLTPALYSALPRADKVLSDADFASVLGDVDLLARSGFVGYQDALPLAARQANNPSPRAARRAFDLADNMPPELVAPPNTQKYAAWLRRQYGARAHFIGWVPRKNESPEQLRLREIAVPLLADRGQDAALAREARRLAQRWLADRNALPTQVRRVVLETAARTSGKDAPVLFDRLLAVATVTKDQNERDDLYGALGSFRDPALVRRALDLTLDPAREPRAITKIVAPALRHPASRPVALAWLQANYDALSARMPREQQAFIVTWAAGICGPGERAQFAALFEKRMADVDAGARFYRQSLEKIDACLSLRRVQEGPLNAFLAQQK